MVAISLVFFLATATGLQSVRPDTTGPSQLEGTILRVHRLPKSSGARSFIGEVLIEQAPQVAGQRPLLANVRISAGTRIYGPDGSPLGFTELKPGMRVGVWFSGSMVFPTYPLQAVATFLAVRPPRPISGGGGPTYYVTPDPRSSSRPIRVGGNVQASKLLERVEPEYPKGAQELGIQGVVLLQVTANEAGEVEKVEVVRGHPLLAEAAVAAVKQWRYAPTLLNGKPVPVAFTVTVDFGLDRP